MKKKPSTTVARHSDIIGAVFIVSSRKMTKMFLKLQSEQNSMGSKKSVWDSILHGEKIISDKEAEDAEKLVKKSRKEYGFRQP